MPFDWGAVVSGAGLTAVGTVAWWLLSGPAAKHRDRWIRRAESALAERSPPWRTMRRSSLPLPDFSLLVASLNSDKDGVHQRYVFGRLRQFQGLRVSSVGETIDLDIMGDHQKIVEELERRAKLVLRVHNADFIVFGEVLKEHTSLRLYFCGFRGGLNSNYATYLLQDAELPKHFLEKLTIAIVYELPTRVGVTPSGSLRKENCGGIAYLLPKYESLSHSRALVNEPYLLAQVAIGRMRISEALVYWQQADPKLIDEAIQDGLAAVNAVSSSPYEMVVGATVLAHATYARALTRYDEAFFD